MSVGAYGLVGEYVYGRAFPTLVNQANFLGNGTSQYKIGGTYVERIQSVALRLAAVGAGNRRAVVDFLDQSGVVFASSASPYVVTAGVTSIIVFSASVNVAGADDSPRITVPMPQPFLQPTYSVLITILGGLVADGVTNVRILTERFSTAPADFSPGQGHEVTPAVERRELIPSYNANR